MPISTTSRKAGPYPGNGVARDFSFNFKIFSTDELRVSVTNAAGAEQVLVFNNDYTVALNPDQDADAGGVVTLNRALASGSRLVILSDVVMLQPIDMTNQGGFYPDVVNEGLDRATAQVQQLSERMGRSITVPPSYAAGGLQLPEPQSGQLLAWSDDGLSNLDPAGLVTVVAYGNAVVDKFEGDGLTTTFSLSSSPGTERNMRVSVAGVVQTPGEDFTWGGGQVLVFSVPPPAGTRIVVQFQEALPEFGSAQADLSNVDDSVIDNRVRRAIGGDLEDRVRKDQLLSSEGAGAVGFAHDETYDPSSVGSKLRLLVFVDDAPFNGDLQAAVNYASARGGGTVTYSRSPTAIGEGQVLTIPRNVAIVGCSKDADPGNPAFAGRTGGYAALAALPKITMHPTAKIVPLGSNQIEGVCFARQGLLFDGTDEAADYAGTAVEIGATDRTNFVRCAFLGFQQAIKADNTARWTAESNLIDCNNGIWQDTSFDKTFVLFNHCYGVLQAGVTGSDPRTKRDGYAYRFTGSSNGGPNLIGNFAYGFRNSFHLNTGGHYGCTDNWADGPYDSVTGLPLWSDSVGVFVGSAGSPNAEVNLTGFKTCSHAVNVRIGAGNYGTVFVLGSNNWGAWNAIEIAGEKVSIVSAGIRSYYGTGIIFQNAAAANTATLIDVSFYDAGHSAVAEIDYGGGDPLEFGARRYGGVLRAANRVPVSAARDGTGLVIAPEGRDQFSVTGSGAIGDIQPRIPGKVITVTFVGNGLSLTGGNFKTTAAFAGNDGSSITLRCNPAGTQWVEQSRAVF